VVVAREVAEYPEKVLEPEVQVVVVLLLFAIPKYIA
jgi:hypothetical protein